MVQPVRPRASGLSADRGVSFPAAYFQRLMPECRNRQRRAPPAHRSRIRIGGGSIRRGLFPGSAAYGDFQNPASFYRAASGALYPRSESRSPAKGYATSERSRRAGGSNRRGSPESSGRRRRWSSLIRHAHLSVKSMAGEQRKRTFGWHPDCTQRRY